MVEKSILVGHGVGPEQCSKMEAQSWVSHQRGSVGHTDGEMGRRREGLDRTDDENATPEGGCLSELVRVNEAANG